MLLFVACLFCFRKNNSNKKEKPSPMMAPEISIVQSIVCKRKLYFPPTRFTNIWDQNIFVWTPLRISPPLHFSLPTLQFLLRTKSVYVDMTEMCMINQKASVFSATCNNAIIFVLQTKRPSWIHIVYVIV